MIVLGAVIAAVLVALRVHPAVAVAAAVMVGAPLMGLIGLLSAAVWVLARRWLASRRGDDSEAAVLTMLASAVESGATVRQALLDTKSARVTPAVRRRCIAGRPITEVIEGLGAGFPDTFRELSVVVEQSESVGSRAASALHGLAGAAREAEQRDRDLRVAVAQSRFSAIVVGVVPLGVAVVLVAIRGVPDPGGAAVILPMVLGATMMAAGSGLVFATSRKVPT